MGTRVKLSEEHPVDVVHRISAGVLGAGLWVFAALGFINSGGFFSTQGTTVFGLSNNGALSALSVAAGLVLLLSAVWGGRLASAALTVMGVLFLLSGLVHLAILHTGLNILAFRLPNVFFSLIVGTLLSVLGLYGRASGGLPPDNPYRRMAPRRRRRPSPSEQLAAADQESPRLERAEQAMGEGTASPQQENLVRQDQTRRRAEEFNRAYRHLAERRGGDAGTR